MNATGKSADVRVLFHESGHGFHATSVGSGSAMKLETSTNHPTFSVINSGASPAMEPKQIMSPELRLSMSGITVFTR